MSADPTVKDLLERNKHYAANASPLPVFSDLSSVGLTTPHILIRLFPQPPPPSHFPLTHTQSPAGTHAVSRNDSWGFGQLVCHPNTCGQAAPALNDILALDHFIPFSDIMVIHHTNCGSLAFTDAQVCATLQQRQPNDKSIDTMSFGTFKDLEKGVRDDLAVIKGSNLMR
ncbi:hypothetical protein IMSHALPRED_002269 [Imshaugia aleurites]|uniref:Carbonic anhydrase n=1 Tax=Imshaugia aleurites TaxID=172621 RepID=A0A8H3IBQ4_9LECA|nr:hypothetical protein IMSHALPRED_002269 [Imshaugia aleurites]